MQQSQPRGNQSQSSDNRGETRGDNRGDSRGDNRNQQRGRTGGGNRPNGNRGGSNQRRPFRPPSSIANEIVNYSSRRLGNLSKIVILLLAVLAGGLLAIAGVFAVKLATGAEGLIWQQFALALGFATGFFLVLGSNSVLFTEANVVVPANLYNVTLVKGFLNLFIFWLLAWIGNYAGVVMVVGLLKSAGVSLTDSAAVLTELVDKNITLSTNTGFISLVVSGILANWVMGITTMYCGYQRAAFSKIAALFLAVCVILFTHLQLFPINMVLLGLTSLAHDPLVTWWPYVINNLIPVSVGNLIGGAFFVALPLAMQTVRKVQRSV